MSDTTPALRLAHIIDPEAFEFHEIEERRKVAAIQWSARRHMAHEHAVRVLESDWLAARDARIREDALGPVRALVEEYGPRQYDEIDVPWVEVSRIRAAIDTPAQADGGERV